MKKLLFLACAIVLGLPATLRATDEIRFIQNPVPRDEARILALAGVREYRCDYQLSHFSPNTLLIAELYEDGKCTHRYRMSRAVYDEQKKTTQGIISVGWNRDSKTLVTVNDNGDYYTPWTASVSLPAFKPMDGHFFASSSAETRKPYHPESVSYALYPVFGWCSETRMKMAYERDVDVPGYLKACQLAGARQVVILYLYQATGGEEPSMRFDKD